MEDTLKPGDPGFNYNAAILGVLIRHLPEDQFAAKFGVTKEEVLAKVDRLSEIIEQGEHGDYSRGEELFKLMSYMQGLMEKMD